MHSATFLSGFHDHGRIREQRHGAIANWKILLRHCAADRKLSDYQLFALHESLERLVFFWIICVEWCADDRDSFSTGLNRAGMRGCVNSFRKSTYHHDAVIDQGARQCARTLETLRRSLSRAYN